MSDIFTVTASVVALGASILSGPLGPLDARPALDLHGAPNSGVVAVAYRDGELAGTIGKDSPKAAYGDFPPLFFQALQSAEDASFSRHMGLDPAGIARAGIDLVRSATSGAAPGVGGSTLTQQLAKNVVTGSSRSIARKLADMISAVETESVASKKEILESYANAVYFGRGSHGAKDAAQNWFGKDWDKLDLGEIAFLAGIVQAPSALDPLKHPEGCQDPARLRSRSHGRRRRDHPGEGRCGEGASRSTSSSRSRPRSRRTRPCPTRTSGPLPTPAGSFRSRQPQIGPPIRSAGSRRWSCRFPAPPRRSSRTISQRACRSSRPLSVMRRSAPSSTGMSRTFPIRARSPMRRRRSRPAFPPALFASSCARRPPAAWT